MQHNHSHACFKNIKVNYIIGKFLYELFIHRDFPFHSCYFQEKQPAQMKTV